MVQVDFIERNAEKMRKQITILGYDRLLKIRYACDVEVHLLRHFIKQTNQRYKILRLRNAGPSLKMIFIIRKSNILFKTSESIYEMYNRLLKVYQNNWENKRLSG